MGKGDSSKRSSSAAAAKSGGPIKDQYPALYAGMSRFIYDESNFESSIANNDCVEALGECTSLQEAFEVPLRKKLLSMDGALHWAYFLATAPERAAEDGDSTPPGFSPKTAFATIREVYDNGHQSVVLDHFEPDSDEESDEEEEAEA